MNEAKAKAEVEVKSEAEVEVKSACLNFQKRD
jgi:hypothetical protein